VRGGATWEVATIKDREVGALSFVEALQGKVEREELRERGVEDIREGAKSQGGAAARLSERDLRVRC
jgi:hypothetical protein